jgi:hypothetical protein
MPNVVQEGNQFGQGSVMVWDGISIDDHMDPVIIHGNFTTAGTSSRYYSMCCLLHMVLAPNLYSCTTMPGVM